MTKQFHIPSYTPKRSEIRHSNNCIQMCTAVQFTTAKKQKPKCSSTNEKTNCSLTIQWCIIQSQKGMKLGCLQRHAWTQRMPYRIKSEKEKQIAYINVIHRIQKNGIDDLICKTEIETQMQRANIWTPRGKVGWDELGMTYVHCCV